MAGEPTPEERLEIVLARTFGDSSAVAVLAASKVREALRKPLLDELRDAVFSARAKAFEEAATRLDDIAAARRADNLPAAACYYDDAAERVRSLAKEAPRG